jgi:DNA-binding NarL/FixJ family response regulator
MRVLVADDDARVCAALRLVVDEMPGLQVVGELRSARDLVRQVARCRPDVLFLDWDQPALEHGAVLPALRARCPGLQVVTLGNDPTARRAALLAGADYFVAKTDPPDDLLACLHALPARNAPIVTAA